MIQVQTPDFVDARRGLLLAMGLLLGLALLAACDGGDEGGITPTATPAGTLEASLTPGAETGEAPIFWRTEDQFQSLRAGEPYKVGLRVTNGYDEETLRVLAEPEGGGPEVEFEAIRVEPVGPEEPGTFYHFLLELPQTGSWRVTAAAGDDEDTITVEVGSPDSSAD